MKIAILHAHDDDRLLLSPEYVASLDEHEVIAEHGADGAWPETASRAALLADAGLVLCVGWLNLDDIAMLPVEAVVISLLRLERAPVAIRQAFRQRGIACLSVDRLDDGNAMEVLRRLCGAMVPQLVTGALPGRLLGGIDGLPPVEVQVIGADTLGRMAAEQLVGTGAVVWLIDPDPDRLKPPIPGVFCAVYPRPIVDLTVLAEGESPDGLILDLREACRQGTDPTRSLPQTATALLSRQLIADIRLLADGASPTGHRRFASALYWGEDDDGMSLHHLG